MSFLSSRTDMDDDVVDVTSLLALDVVEQTSIGVVSAAFFVSLSSSLPVTLLW